MASDQEKMAWLERVLGVHIGVDRPSNDTASLDDPFDFVNRMAAAARQLDGLKAKGDPALPVLLPAYAKANATVKAKAPEAATAVEELEAALSLAASAARGRAAGAGNTGKVAYAKLLLRWHDAQNRVDDNLRALGQALLSDPEVRADPDFDEIEEAVADLPDLVPDLGEKLDDVLDAARDPAADSVALNRQALAIIAEYRSRLGAVSALRDLETFSAVTSAGKIGLFSEFNTALNDLEAELGKAA